MIFVDVFHSCSNARHSTRTIYNSAFSPVNELGNRFEAVEERGFLRFVGMSTCSGNYESGGSIMNGALSDCSIEVRGVLQFYRKAMNVAASSEDNTGCQNMDLVNIASRRK
jgi:hypothetical protein